MRDEDNKIAKGQIRSLSYLKRYLVPYKKQILVVIIALIISSLSVLMIGQCLKEIIDKGLIASSSSGLNSAFLLLLLVTTLLSLATCARYYFITNIGEKVVCDIKKDIFKHLLGLSVDFYEKARTGDLLSRITTDINILQHMIGGGISVALRNIVTLIVGLIMLSTISFKLFSLILIVVPVIVIPIVLFGKQMRRYSRAAHDSSGDIAAMTEEMIVGIRTIQAFTQEPSEYVKFKCALKGYMEVATKRIKTRSFLITLVISLTFSSVALVLWTGSQDVIRGVLSPGSLSSFVFIAILSAGSIGSLTDIIGDLQRAGGATERIVELLKTHTKIKNIAKGAVVLPSSSKGKIIFNEVTFFYPSRPEKAILDGLNLEIIPGKTTAIVGESGAGKSTIFQLLLRFYDIQSGLITFDNHSISELDLKSLRSQFAYVSQEPMIFSDTVLENVRYGKYNASKEEIWEALDKASAFEFVEKLPQGIDTYLGEKGVQLSMGQKQRLVIARAFLRDPRILLFDEATSALDSSNEKKVQLAMEKLMKGRTTLIIAHRLSTVLKADKIIVIKNGKIVEEGDHKHLFSLKGEYYNLANLQFSQV